MNEYKVPRIIAVETALPQLSLTQPQVWELFNERKVLTKKEKVFYKRFLLDESIQERHVACNNISEVFEQTPDQLHARYEKFAVDLGSKAVEKCCRSAGISPEELDGLIVTTCTGYLCPGLTSYISGVLGLKPDLITYDLVGHGCGAALPALRLAKQCLTQSGCRNIAVVSVEICTAAIYWGEDIGLMLSNAIFADGAAAAIVSARDDRAGVVLEEFESLLWPFYRDELRFKQENSRLCNVLSKNVPDIVSRSVLELSNKLKSIEHRNIHYALHTGGRRILDAIAHVLCIDDEKMKYSRNILKWHGNMSSPSVLFVIKNMMENQIFKNGDKLMMFTFGAGFSAYGAIGQWKQPQLVERNNYVCKEYSYQ